MSTFTCEQPSSWDRCLESNGPSSFSSETSTSSDGPWLWGIWCVHVLLLSALCCTDSWLMLMQDLLYYMFSWFLAWFDAEYSMWCTCHNSSCYVLRSLVVCFWDTLVVVMHVFFFDIPFVPCWRDAHHACFCVILIGVFWLRVLVVEHILEPLLREGILPCMIETSSLLTTLNAVAYTTLTSGPGDVVPLGQTPLSAYVFMCYDFYVPLLYSMQMYSLMFL